MNSNEKKIEENDLGNSSFVKTESVTLPPNSAALIIEMMADGENFTARLLGHVADVDDVPMDTELPFSHQLTIGLWSILNNSPELVLENMSQYVSSLMETPVKYDA